VEVAVRSSDAAAFNLITVCRLEREEGHSGIGIFTPSSPPAAHPERLEFYVSVVLPQSRQSPLYIAALETHLPLFSHTILKSPSGVTFGSVKFDSSNTLVQVQSLNAANVSLKTSNSAIWGNFNVSQSLELITSNGQIRANVAMYHDDAPNTHTSLKMRTTNSPVISTVDLVSTAADSTGGAFTIDSRTSNNKIDLDVHTMPLDSVLQLDARTSNALARVGLSPAYEGSFLLQTSNASPSVRRSDQPEDPAGQDRRRRLYVAQNKGAVHGEVLWGDTRREHLGDVQVKSTNREVILDLL